MPYCPNCGTSAQASDRFCRNCGRDLATRVIIESTTGAQTVETPRATATPELATIISMERIVLLSILSAGLYWVYWFYLTWKHYRDHTKREAYPVWHALTLLVPVYSLFRVHAHVRSFKELSLGSGVRTSIIPGWAVAGVAVKSALDVASFQLALSQGGREAAVASAFLAVLSIGIVTWLLAYVQEDLNAYWKSIRGVKSISAKTGKGEIVVGVVGVIGVLVWLSTIV